MKEILISIFYPRRCPVCGDIVPIGTYFHEECEKKIIKVTPGCAKCGKPLERGTLCGDCAEYEHLFNEGRGLFLYEGPVRDSLSALKYLGKKEYGEALGKLMYFYGRKYIEKWKPDIIVPVPVHRARKRERGYNQAEVLAREISKGSGIPVRSDLIVRRTNTQALKKLTPSERREQTKEAFCAGRSAAVRNESAAGRGAAHDRSPAGIGRALIVDDIYTTGSTIDACAGVLRDMGAEKVFFLTACIGKDKSSGSPPAF